MITTKYLTKDSLLIQITNQKPDRLVIKGESTSIKIFCAGKINHNKNNAAYKFLESQEVGFIFQSITRFKLENIKLIGSIIGNNKMQNMEKQE